MESDSIIVLGNTFQFLTTPSVKKFPNFRSDIFAIYLKSLTSGHQPTCLSKHLSYVLLSWRSVEAGYATFNSCQVSTCRHPSTGTVQLGLISAAKNMITVHSLPPQPPLLRSDAMIFWFGTVASAEDVKLRCFLTDGGLKSSPKWCWINWTVWDWGLQMFVTYKEMGYKYELIR